MKFKSHVAHDCLTHVFSLYVGEEDIAQAVQSQREFRGFTWTVMNRLSMMVAAYYFKRHKTTFDEFLSSPEIKSMIAEKLAERLEVSMRS